MCAAKTSKTRKTRLELDIERNRAEGNLKKALELAHAFKNDKNGTNVCLFNILYCENKLEPAEKDVSLAIDFSGAEVAADEALSTADEHYRIDALILKAKIAYLQEKHSDVVDILAKANLRSLKIESYTSKSTRLLSEGFAMLGISEERILTKADVHCVPLEIYDYWDLACNICIRHLQEIEATLPENSPPVGIPRVVELAIKRRVLSSLQKNNVAEIISRFREILRFVETPSTKSLRQSLARQLAEILLRVVCTGNYQKYQVSCDAPKSVLVDYQMPFRYSPDNYVPDDQLHEAILMLLISEYIASQDVILNRSMELSEERGKTVNETITVYDLLAIALVRKGCYTFLSKTLEHALKFSFHEFQIWYQFALSLISSRKYYRAYLVLRECQRIDSNNTPVYLLASSLCLGHLHLIEEGMVFAAKGVEVATRGSESFLCARAHLMLGWGYSISARECRLRQRKNELQNLAVEEYTAATIADPDDHLAWYHLAVELAVQRQIDESLKACQRSILLSPTTPDTIRLLALLHTAATASEGGSDTGEDGRRRRLDHAVRALNGALVDNPYDFDLYFTLASVESELHGAQAALQIHMQLLEVWRDCFASMNSRECAAFLDRLQFPSSNGQSHQPSTELSSLSITAMDFLSSDAPDMDFRGVCLIGSNATIGFTPSTRIESIFSNMIGTNSLSAPSVGATGTFSRSIGVPSIPPASPRKREEAPTLPSTKHSVFAHGVLARILGTMAELYLDLDRLQDARSCVEEAIAVSKLSHELLYLRGRILEADMQTDAAKSMYESVISINPSHVKALFALARIMYGNEQYILAEQVLRDALAVDSTNSRVWRLLGEVLSHSDASDPASKVTSTKAFLSAIELEQSEPIEPFYTLRLGVYCS